MTTNMNASRKFRVWLGRSTQRIRAHYAVLTIALLIAVGLVTLPATANADLPVGLQQGALMPIRYVDQFDGGRIHSASADYGIHDIRTYNEYGTSTYSIVRLSDGATVRQITQDAFKAPPQVVGDTVVDIPDGTSTSNSVVTMTDAESGAVTATVPLPGNRAANQWARVVHADSHWVATNRVGVDTAQNYLDFRRPDGSSVETPYDFDSTPQWIGGDSTVAYVTDGQGSYQVDPTTGVVTTLAFGTPGVTLLGVTADSLVGTKTSYVSTNSVLSVITTVVFMSRTTLEVTKQFQVQTAQAPDLFPYRDSVADVETTSGVPYRREVLPVDPTTGAELAPVLTNVTDVKSLGDGRIAAMVADGPDAHLVVAPESGATRVVATAPRRAQSVDGVNLWGGQLAASFDGSSGVWTTDTTTPAWQQTFPTPDFDINDRDRSIDFGGGNLLTATTYPGDSAVPGYRVSWAGGTRDFTGYDAALDRSGTFVETITPDAKGTQIQDARTGQVISSWTGQSQKVIDGSWAWSGPDAAGNLTAHDLSGSQADRVIPVGASCTKDSLENVWGRWARLYCGGSGDIVLDLLGAYPSVRIASNSQLGNGFVAWTTVAQPAGIEDVLELHVMELATQTEKDYGPLRGAPYPPGAAWAVDNAGASAVAYVDYQQQARVADLNWIATPSPVTAADLPQADLAAPVLLQASTLAPRVPAATGNVQLSWTFNDPTVTDHVTSGLGTYDVLKSSDGGATWTAPAAWQAMASASITDSLPADTGACYSARARDEAGNTSAQTAAVCTFADGTTPTLMRLTGGATYPSSLTGRASISGTFFDEDGVASYDFEARSAPRGRDFGAWQAVASARTSPSYVTGYLAAGSETCLRMRSRDTVGNVSPWTAAKCTTLPLDSTWLSGGATYRSSLALGGSFRALTSNGARVRLAGQYGRQVVVTFLCGPGRAAAQVYLGSRSLGSTSLTASRVSRCTRTFTAPRDTAGSVQIVQRSRGVVDVDAIAAGR